MKTSPLAAVILRTFSATDLKDGVGFLQQMGGSREEHGVGPGYVDFPASRQS